MESDDHPSGGADSLRHDSFPCHNSVCGETLRLRFRYGMMVGLTLGPSLVVLGGVFGYRLLQAEAVHQSELFAMLSWLLLLMVGVPLAIQLFASTFPSLTLDCETDTGTLKRPKYSERLFRPSAIEAVEIREVIQSGPENGEDLYPRDAVQLNLLLVDHDDGQFHLIETLDEVTCVRVAEQIGSFLGVPVRRRRTGVKLDSATASPAANAWPATQT